MLGRPRGRAIYPIADREDETAKLETFEKALKITYGKDGAVTNVDFSESGKC